MSWVWWGTPVIPEAWEAEAGGAQVQGQPQKFSEALSNLARSCFKIKNKKRAGDVVQWLSTPGFNPQDQKIKKG